MIKNIFYSIISLVILCSCGKSGGEDVIGGDTYVLLNSDSTSVITSSSDTVTVSYQYIRNGVLQKVKERVSIFPYQKDYLTSFSSTWSVNDSVYTIPIPGIDSVFMECKGRIDTVVIIQDPFWSYEPLEIIFNGKRIYKRHYDGELVPLVRE